MDQTATGSNWPRDIAALQDRQGCRLIFGHDPAQWAKMRHAPESMA
jgi:hypothetical protein